MRAQFLQERRLDALEFGRQRLPREPHAAVGQVVGAKGNGIDQGAVAGVAHPNRPARMWAVDIGVEHAETDGIGLHLPDLGQCLVGAGEMAYLRHGVSGHVIADVPDAHGAIEAAQRERKIAEAATLVRAEDLPPLPAHIPEAVAGVHRPEDTAVVDTFEAAAVEDRARRGVEVELEIADRLLAKVEHKVDIPNVPIGLGIDGGPGSGIGEQGVRRVDQLPFARKRRSGVARVISIGAEASLGGIEVLTGGEGEDIGLVGRRRDRDTAGIGRQVVETSYLERCSNSGLNSFIGPTNTQAAPSSTRSAEKVSGWSHSKSSDGHSGLRSTQ